MEKLLRDLNIYAHSFVECNLTFTYDWNRIRVRWDEIWPYVAESIIINKKFWFIQWLVENEKIEENSDLITLASELWCAFNTDVLLMYLAIQDNPIEYLCEILK